MTCQHFFTVQALGRVGFQGLTVDCSLCGYRCLCVFFLFLRYQLGELGGVQCLYLCYTAHSCVLYWRPGLHSTIGGDPRRILGQISRITNPEDSRYGFLFICAFSLFVTFCKMGFLKSFFFKNVFYGSVGNDLFTWLVRVGVRLCTSGSPHTPRMWKIFGSCCCCCCCCCYCWVPNIVPVPRRNRMVRMSIDFKDLDKARC